MTPPELLGRRRGRLRLVIFDCDGVIVDSERISNGVLARDFSARGWPMTVDQAEHLFIGTTIEAIQPRAEAAMGRRLPDDWRASIKAAIIEALARDAAPIPGAVETLRALSAAGIRWRIASNSSHAELVVKFRRLGIADLVAGRVHSFEDVRQGKPAPDLFLAAAAAEGVAPAECLVIEDSVPGVTAARAAGMDCLGFDRSTDGRVLREAGAVPFHDMALLPGWITSAVGQEAV
jgi:HAD superfamily hydrolase (TIGR01509 family)